MAKGKPKCANMEIWIYGGTADRRDRMAEKEDTGNRCNSSSSTENHKEAGEILWCHEQVLRSKQQDLQSCHSFFDHECRYANLLSMWPGVFFVSATCLPASPGFLDFQGKHRLCVGSWAKRPQKSNFITLLFTKNHRSSKTFQLLVKNLSLE